MTSFKKGPLALNTPIHNFVCSKNLGKSDNIGRIIENKKREKLKKIDRLKETSFRRTSSLMKKVHLHPPSQPENWA